MPIWKKVKNDGILFSLSLKGTQRILQIILLFIIFPIEGLWFFFFFFFFFFLVNWFCFYAPNFEEVVWACLTSICPLRFA